ncbi:nucleoside hydrolase [Paenibacillus sp. 102]|uniref:nucleoside hydrolase n=1 Tax=Paenibacillus sp. 102 TaxID=3120823 RepID=UPI0031BA9BFD
MGKKVLFFGDIGIDDAIALIFTYLTDKIDIVGIVADYGNVSREIAARNVRYLAGKIGKMDIKIMGGAQRSMTGEVPVYYPEIHGFHGLGPIVPPSDIPAEELENFFGVIEIIERYKEEIIIVNTGRLTSLATMFILYGDLMKQIKSYYIMGGAFLYPGNVTPVSEANFYGDPVAANLVFKYAKNVSIYPLNVTQRAIVTPEMVNYIHSKGKTDLVKPLLDYYYDFYKKRVPNIQGSPVHDILPLMGIMYDDMFTYYESQILIAENGTARGQSVGDFRNFFTPENLDNRPRQRVAVNFDYNKFFKEFMTVMTKEQF